MTESELRESLAKLQPGDEVVVCAQIVQVKRTSKLYIFIMYGNHERRFRIKDGYAPSSDGGYTRNRARLIPVTDELRAHIKLKCSREKLKAMLSHTLENLPQEAVDEMTGRLRMYKN